MSLGRLVADGMVILDLVCDEMDHHWCWQALDSWRLRQITCFGVIDAGMQTPCSGMQAVRSQSSCCQPILGLSCLRGRARLTTDGEVVTFRTWRFCSGLQRFVCWMKANKWADASLEELCTFVTGLFSWDGILSVSYETRSGKQISQHLTFHETHVGNRICSPCLNDPWPCIELIRYGGKTNRCLSVSCIHVMYIIYIHSMYILCLLRVLELTILHLCVCSNSFCNISFAIYLREDDHKSGRNM